MNTNQASFKVWETAEELPELAKSEGRRVGIRNDFGDGVEAVRDGSALVKGEVSFDSIRVVIEEEARDSLNRYQWLTHPLSELSSPERRLAMIQNGE